METPALSTREKAPLVPPFGPEGLPREIAGFRGYHRDQAIVVCGCGNSLSGFKDPGRFITIGVNDVGRLFDPTYLVILNPPGQFKGDRFAYVRDSRAEAIFTQLNLGIPHPHIVRFQLGQRGGHTALPNGALPYTRNSPYVALCLARYMGATRIGLIGVDFTDHHFFGQTGRHPLAPTFDQIDREYKALAAACAQDGVEVYNLSSTSRLTGLPKLDLAEFTELAAPRGLPLAGGPPLRILQLSRTNCAGAIWHLHDVLNRYSEHECRTITQSPVTSGRRYRTDVLFSDRAEVERLLAQADVLHFHNTLDPDHSLLAAYRHLIAPKHKILQYHTEPGLLAPHFRGQDPARRADLLTLVIAQKHARFYPYSEVVPNVLDIDNALLQPSPTRRYAGGPLKVIYAPTDRNSYPDYTQTCRGKGYTETLPVLRRLEQERLIALTVVDGLMPWEEFMPLKREHDVCIDEVVTGGYHLSSLEALAQGLVTVARLDSATRDAIRRVTGCDTSLPWYESSAATLEADLRRLCALPSEKINELKAAGRAWMETHWHPARLVRLFTRAYRRPPVVLPPADIHEVFRPTRLLPVYDRPVALQPELQQLRGAWKHRQVVIWGNGPSAREAPPVWERDAAHIGVNHSWPVLRDKFDLYCASDQRFVNSLEKRAIVERAPGVRAYLAHMRDVITDHTGISYIATAGAEGFSSDLTIGVFHGYSVVWVALQAALWTGASDILLVGCEHTYTPGRLRCYEDSNPTPVERVTLGQIVSNYRRLMPLIEARRIRLRTVGESHLQSAGVPRFA